MHDAGERLFDFLAGCIDSFIREHAPGKEAGTGPRFHVLLPRGAAFGIFRHTHRWTKAFTASGVEGEDVAALLSGP